jgi:hypothetical protein
MLIASAVVAHAAEDGPALIFDGLKLTPTEADAKVKRVTVKADGSIVSDGKPAGKIVKNEIQDAAGVTLFKVMKDGTVTGPAVNTRLRFNGKDELVDEDGRKLIVADDGTARYEQGDKRKPARLKIEGVSVKTRRAAVLLVGLLDILITARVTEELAPVPTK